LTTAVMHEHLLAS